MAQKCSKLIRLVPIVLTVIQENFFLYHHIPTAMVYCTDCFIPTGLFFPPLLNCGMANFSRDEYWMWEMAFSQIVWGRERGQKAYFTCHEEEGGLTFFIFLAILSLIYIMLEILIYRWGECLNRVNFWYLPLGSFSYIYKTWWYF